MYLLIAAALVISLIIVAAPARKVSADCTADVCAEWERVPSPTMDDWVLAPGCTIIDYALASEGDVAYALVWAYDEEYSNGMYRLLKSEDGAATWADLTDKIDDVIDPDNEDLNTIYELVLVATDWVDPEFVAVAVMWWDNDDSYYYLNVFISTDGGDNFIDAGEVEEGGVFFDVDSAGDADDVTDLAVSYEAGGKRDIAICGMDDSGLSALFRCTVTGDTPGPWRDTTEYDGWDDNDNLFGMGYVSLIVSDIIFSPDWGTDKTILAVTITDGSVTDDAAHLQSGAWGATTGNWNLDGDFEDAVLVKDNVDIPQWVMDDDGRGMAGVVLPNNYSGADSDTRYAWVWVNYYDSNIGMSQGEILRVRDGAVDSVDTQISGMPWLTNVSYWGNIAGGTAIAGVLADSQPYPLQSMDLIKPCCEGVQVYRNLKIEYMEICCLEWEEACKPPTGRTSMAVSYVSADKAYAVALQDYVMSYDEDAWSVSCDGGDTWNQLSLIDTWITYLSDVAVSPDCNKIMLVSVNEDYWANDVTLPPPFVCYIIINDLGGGLYDLRILYCDSVWVYADTFPEAGYSDYSGHWLRTWCGPLMGDNYQDPDDFPWVEERGLLRLAPEETDGMTVYLIDRMTDTIYWNEEETLACWKTRSSAAGGIDEIVDLGAKDEATIYALDFDGNVAMSDDHGASLTWTDSVDSKVDEGWTIAVHGDDILVGGRDGEVSHSADGGETFTALDDVSDNSNAHVTVAFDSYFDQNDTIYAALANAFEDNGIYIWVIGAEPELWHKTNARPYNYTGLVLDRPSPSNPYTSAETGGVLYASYLSWGDWEGWEPNCDCCQCDDYGECEDYSCWATGVARCLTPITELCCGVGEAEWDYLTWGLVNTSGSTPPYPTQFRMPPQALKICGCLTADSNSKLFAIDGAYYYSMYEDAQDGFVWTFEDCYAKKAVELVSPVDGFVVPTDICECCNAPFSIKWDRLCDACCYEIQFALDEDFTDIVELVDIMGLLDLLEKMPDGIDLNIYDCYCPSSPMNPSAWIGCYFNPEFTYYWRVRASQAETCQEIHSWWSDPLSFTVAPKASAAAITLVSPEPGATSVAIEDVGFSWTLLASADAFDWVLDNNADFSSPVESKTGLTRTAYGCTKTLTYDTTYYWQVTAYKDGSAISMSAVGTFRTQTEKEAEEVAAAKTPFWVWVVIAIGAVLVIVVIVLIFRTRRV
jgi:hypothetical protein